MSRTAPTVAALLAGACGVVAAGGSASVAAAQSMDLTPNRLRIEAAPDTDCAPDFGSGFRRDWCADGDAWRSLATQFSSILIPAALGPARTRGPRSFYLGLELGLTGIDASADYWQRGTAGRGSSGMNGAVDGALALVRGNVRKALPFGFEIGGTAGYLANTSYWVVGLDVRWALLEGWTGHNNLVPDFSVRGAVTTMMGNGLVNGTVATVDATLSNSVILGDGFELSPYVTGQLNWVFMDSELVDLTPETSAFDECDPDPSTPEAPRSTCRGDGTDYNHNVVFPSVRTMRPRLVLGAQGRYDAVTLNAALSFDLMSPHDTDTTLSRTLDRQWRLDVGLGLSY